MQRNVCTLYESGKTGKDMWMNDVFISGCGVLLGQQDLKPAPLSGRNLSKPSRSEMDIDYRMDTGNYYVYIASVSTLVVVISIRNALHRGGK